MASPSGQAGLVVPVSALLGPTVIGTPGASAKAKAAQIRKMAEAWETGSAGEEHTAAQLTRLPPSFFVLHDLHVPGSDANIDHLVVGPNGVWLIDTKAYSQPLRLWEGALCHGRYPMTREIEAVIGYAGVVEQLLKVPVAAVLCFVGNVVPPQARRLREASLVSLDDLVDLLLQGQAPPLADVESVARLARTLRTPSPAPSTNPAPRPTGEIPSAPASRSQSLKPFKSSSPTGSARSNPSMASLRRLLVVLAVCAGLLVFLWRGAQQIPRLAQRAGPALVSLLGPDAVTTTTLAVPPLNGLTIEVPTPPLALGLLCTVAGAGWEAHVAWPSGIDPAYTPVALEIVSGLSGPAQAPVIWQRGSAPAPVFTGLAPATKVSVVVQAILVDGTRLQPLEVSKDTPPRPC